MTRTELIIQLLKVAIGLAFGAYFVWWSLQVLDRLTPEYDARTAVVARASNAEICLMLARETKEIYAKMALIEMVTEFRVSAASTRWGPSVTPWGRASGRPNHLLFFAWPHASLKCHHAAADDRAAAERVPSPA